MSVLLSTARAIGSAPAPAPGNFTSDAVMWVDTGTELGTVPNTYANYQMIRGMAQHINLHDDCSFTMSAGTHTIIYAHPTNNAPGTYRPDFLTGWTDTGNTGSIQVPDAAGTLQSYDVTYYSSSESGTFTWNFLESTWAEPLSYFPGVFLIPSGVTISAIYPDVYKVVDDISATYSALDGDWWWDPAPSSIAAADVTSGSIAALETDVEGASAGEVIELTNGTYNDDGEIVISNVTGTAADPIFIDLSGCTLNGSTQITLDNCDYVRIWGGTNTSGTGNTSMTRFEIQNDCTWCSLENFDSGSCSQDSDDDSFTTVQISGSYNRVSNCEWDGKTSRGNHINWSPTTGDNTADQFCLIQYNSFDNFNTGQNITAGENAAYIRLGGNNNFQSRAYTLVRQNYMADWNVTPQDAEFLVIKSCGHIISQNVYVANTSNRANSGFFTRTGAWTYVLGNYHDAQSNSANNQGCNIQGMDDTLSGDYLTTHLIHARNFVKDFDGVNGYIGVNQKDPSSGNRWVGIDSFITQMWMYDSVDECISFGDFASSPVTPSGITMKSLALSSTLDIVIEDYDVSSVVDWDSCVFDSDTDHGFDISGLPSGITEEAITWTDRLDGVFTPSHADLTPAVEDHIPVALQGSSIGSNLGIQ